MPQHLSKDVIWPNGLLEDTTRILVTYLQSVLPFVGQIDLIGSYKDLSYKDG